MIYGLQHNGKGTYHLVPTLGEGSELCNSKGILLHSSLDEIEVKNGEVILIEYSGARRKILHWEVKDYCKKCIKKAIKLNAEL